MTWQSSLDGLIGTGYQVVRDDLRPGRHRITLTLPDGAHREASASVWVRILDQDTEPSECAGENGVY